MGGMTNLQIDKILFALDKDESQSVDWTEFIAAALCIKASSEPRLVDMAFSMFDSNSDDKISPSDFEAMFAIGEVANVWKEAIPNECNKIAKGSSSYTKEQFRTYMS